VQIELLSVPKEHLRDAIYKQIFYDEYEDASEHPLAAIIADYEFNASAVDIELLSDIARMAASMQTPFISAAGTAFFGVETAEEQAKLPVLRSLFEQPKYTKWRALRENDIAQSMALTTSRFLLRYPYGPEGEPVKAFSFTEQTTSSTDYLWGRGVYALATAMVNSFIKTGWCTQISGQRGGGVVDNLPLWSYRSAGRTVQIPIDALYSQDREQEFGEFGLTLISCRLNSDAAHVLSAPTVYRPKRYDAPEETQEALLHATLPYQLFATRMARLLRRITKKEISTGLTAENISNIFSSHLRAFLKPADGQPLPKEAVQVEVAESEENPESYEVILRIKPTFRILGRAVDLLLGFEIPR
jgi:type VI secretion system protein ImpC